MFIRFDVIHERDRQTDGQTLHDSKDCACIASRGNKNCLTATGFRRGKTVGFRKHSNLKSVTFLTATAGHSGHRHSKQSKQQQPLMHRPIAANYNNNNNNNRFV